MQGPTAPETHRLRVDVDARPGHEATVVAVRGEADLHTMPILREALYDAVEGSAGTIVVDLSGVTFVDSMMLSILLRASRKARGRGSDVHLVVDDPHVRRIFELTLLDQVLRLYPDLDRALEGPSGG